MQKIMFTEFAELKQGDGLGPKFYPGKAYWLTHDQAERWKAEGVAQDAPPDMRAENERGPDPLRAVDVRLERARGGRYYVVAHGHVFNAEPLKAGDAEKLRARVLAGEIKIERPEEPPMEEVAATVDDTSAAQEAGDSATDAVEAETAAESAGEQPGAAPQA